MNNTFPIERIIFWEPSLSPHKSDFIVEVSKKLPSVEIVCCAQTDIPEDYKARGWEMDSSFSRQIRTIVSPTASEIERLAGEKSSISLHVFSGTRNAFVLVRGLQVVKSVGARFSILAEPRVREGWKGAIRFLQSWLTESWLRSRCEFVLAIGRHGPSWYRSVGYSAEKVFSFAYFVNPPSTLTTVPNRRRKHERKCIHIGYVGRLVPMKGVFDVLQAAVKLGESSRLTIVGSGPDADLLRKTAAADGVHAKFLDAVPIREVGLVMCHLDVLVIASTSADGWGVVVSEALMSGTAVVATSCVGASLILDEDLFGRIVPPNNPNAIAEAIGGLQKVGAFSDKSRWERQRLAKSRLSAAAGARYFVAILQHRLAGGMCPVPFFRYTDRDGESLIKQEVSSGPEHV